MQIGVHHSAPAASAPEATARKQKTVALVQTQAENAGAQEVARQLAAGFEKRGWRTRQIFFFRRTDAFDADPNVVYCANARPSSPAAIIRMLAALYREFRRAQPDAVVTLQHYGNFFAAPVARLVGVPLVIANQLSPPETIPSVIRHADRLMGSIGFYSHIVVNSARTQAEYRDYPAPYLRRVTRIDHGFFDKSGKVSKAEARAALGLPQDAPLLGCAARLHPLKQIDCAIRLLTADERHHLALAGQGEDRVRLEQLAQSLGVSDRTHFVGELDTEKMGCFLAALDCFVFPSSTETFGLAPVEAAQAGVPVVANDIEVLREVLAVDGEPCALFVDATDAPRFADAVRRMLDDKNFAAAMTARGRRLTERYPLDAMIDDYVRLMEPTDRKRVAP